MVCCLKRLFTFWQLFIGCFFNRSLDIGEAVQAAEDLIGPELTVSSRPQTMVRFNF